MLPQPPVGAMLAWRMGLAVARNRYYLDKPVERWDSWSPVGRFPRKRGSRPGRALLQQPCRKHRGQGTSHTFPIQPSI